MSSFQSLDIDTLRERLVTREGQSLSATRGSLSKCALRMREFGRATEAVELDTNDATLAALRTAGGELIRELKLHDLEMKKLALGSQAAEAELSYYDSIKVTTEKSIDSLNTEINVLKNELLDENKRKSRIEEYELLARKASTKPPERVSKRKLQIVEKEIKKIKSETDHIQKKLDVKGKQFHLLLRSISDLKNGIDEDDLRAELDKKLS
eukprot:296114_1